MSAVRIVADDLGWSDAVDAGIADAAAAGSLDAVSALATGPTVASGIARVRAAAPAIPIGLHLDLSDFAPCAAAERIPALAAVDGRFRRPARRLLLALLAGRVPGEQVARELDAQLDRLATLGVAVAHVDGHRHVHLFPRVAAEVARACGARSIGYVRLVPRRAVLRVRLHALPERLALSALSARLGRWLEPAGVTVPRALVGLAHGFHVSADELVRAVREAPEEGVTEVVTHPGRAEAIGRRPHAARALDLRALLAPALREARSATRPAGAEPQAPAHR